jgi:CDP-glycerol glycerophosphotransferase
VRAELGIADETAAVLYTPTWRDDEVFEDGGRDFKLGLEPERLAQDLGDGYCLLCRLHYMVSEHLGPFEHPAIRDVSARPEVSELYLAADVLVTDYSSTMFDFAVTGKPIVFFVHDLEDFKGRVRGFYFDFEPEAPGPMLRTPAELIAAIQGLDGVGDEFADRYASFRERFCHLEDGHATERVAEAALEMVAAAKA